MIQTYKKELKPHLHLGIFLFVIGFEIGNFFWLLPGTNYFSKTNYLFTKDILTHIEQAFYQFFITPSLLGFSVGILGFLLGLLVCVRDNDRGIYRYGEEHGSARFATPAEMRKYEDPIPENNTIVSKHVKVSLFNKRLSIKLQESKNITILGDSGAAKTLAFIKTNLMQRHASFITTDPDGRISPEIGLLLKRGKYEIKVLGLNALSNSDTFNAFECMHSELDMDRVLEAVAEATKEMEEATEDDFWTKTEGLLVHSLVAYSWFDGRRNDYAPYLRVIADMLRHLRQRGRSVPNPVGGWFEEPSETIPDNYTYRQWTLSNNLYKSETGASILGITVARCPVFDHEEVVNMTRTDTMDVNSWNEEKTAVLIAIPETSTSFNFTAALMFATVGEMLRNKSDQVRLGRRVLEEGKELLHVRFLIDEFANVDRIPHFERMLTAFREREMSFTIILQSLNQLQTLYPKGW